MTNSNLKKKKAENLKEVSKKQQRNSFNLVKRKQVNEAKKVVCRWELLNILISARSICDRDRRDPDFGICSEFLWYS